MNHSSMKTEAAKTGDRPKPKIPIPAKPKLVRKSKLMIVEAPDAEPLPPGTLADDLPGLQAFLREPVGFPDYVFPSFGRNLIEAGSQSIHCSPDLLACPMLAVAGAATGRSGRRLIVKEGWTTSSCIWNSCLLESGGGKTPALNMVQGFFTRKQFEEFGEWQKLRDAYEADRDNNPHPGPFPTLMLTDTTIESLRTDLQSGPVLYSNDELGSLCQGMGQYKGGKGGDKFNWCSFWSHTPINIGRKMERVLIQWPFIGITGMMVPASARELNYRGHGDDGFVHRFLLCTPPRMAPVATLDGVPKAIQAEYDQRMNRLFAPPDDDGLLTMSPLASQIIIDWCNDELYAQLPKTSSAPYLESKLRKLYEYCYRLCLVLHELWRVADADERLDEWHDMSCCFEAPVSFNPKVIDVVTVQKAISVIQYFQAHIPHVVSLLGEMVDEVDRQYERLRSQGTLTVREAIHKKVGRNREGVLVVFAEWERRGFGTVDQTRKNQQTFRFGGA